MGHCRSFSSIADVPAFEQLTPFIGPDAGWRRRRIASVKARQTMTIPALSAWIGISCGCLGAGVFPRRALLNVTIARTHGGRRLACTHSGPRNDMGIIEAVLPRETMPAGRRSSRSKSRLWPQTRIWFCGTGLGRRGCLRSYCARSALSLKTAALPVLWCLLGRWVRPLAQEISPITAALALR